MKYTFPLCFIALLLFSVAAQAQTQRINTIAGNGDAAFGGDGHSAVAASLFGPIGVVLDSVGNVYVVDYHNSRIRRVSADTKIITTVAGNGGSGYSGDNSYAASAQINPSAVAIDRKGNLLIADGANCVVRKVNTITGIITTVAGNSSSIYGYSGDGGPATAAKMRACQGLTTDAKGNYYIADAGNHVIRKVDTGGIITTIAGVDTAGYSGDGGAATMAKLDSPMSVAIDGRGYIYIADYRNDVIRMIDDTGVIHTIAGINGSVGRGGDNGPATAAQLNYPRGICVDSKDNLYIADANNNVIRMVDTFGTITRVVGNGSQGFGGDLGYVDGANLNNPYGVAVDSKGHIFIADANNNRIRKTYFETEEGVNMVTVNAATILARPNPFINELTVSGLKKADNVCVYDAAGRQVSEIATAGADGTHTFIINGLASGVYMLQVWNGEGSVKATLKVVKE